MWFLFQWVGMELSCKHGALVTSESQLWQLLKVKTLRHLAWYCGKPSSVQDTVPSIICPCPFTSDPIGASMASSAFSSSSLIWPANHQLTGLSSTFQGSWSSEGGGPVGELPRWGSFKVIFIFVIIQVQVAVWAGDLKEVSLCQTQIAGDVLPEGVQRVVVAKQTESDVRKEPGG